MTHIWPDRIFVSCHPMDLGDVRLRVVSYTEGDARAVVVDASTGKRRRGILTVSLHATARTRTGRQRLTGYAPAEEEAPADSRSEEATEKDWFDGLPGRRFLVRLPPGLDLLNANDRLHHHERARKTRALRQAARFASRGLPKLDRVHVIGVFHPQDRRRRDPANWYPTFKALLDGLVDQGVIQDDDHTRLVGPDMRIGEVTLGPRLALHIRDLGASGLGK
ncbi:MULTISPECIES: hypothetical protein [unclassified Streptomyces]|uniref:hypothetical protein n=1 Tax=unclassified Streptomyces TaxID=2593676 RepID=UPI002E164B97|nr:hypothetical protein OG457_30655 [Streptomyces sp. NBC_01207]